MSSTERGASLIELLVSLAIGALLLLGVHYFFQFSFQMGERLSRGYELVQNLSALEIAWRKEFDRLIAAPECPGLLPPDEAVQLGRGVTERERELFQQGVVIHRSSNTLDELDFKAPKTEGGSRFNPLLPKNLSRLLRGSDVVQVSGLLSFNAELAGDLLLGEFPVELDGRREQLFYFTDCHQGWLVKGVRERGGFRLAAKDREAFEGSSFQSLLVYGVMERLLYLQLEGGEPYLVQDYFDGQTFLRTANIYQLRAEITEDRAFLWLSLLAGTPGRGEKIVEGDQFGDFITAPISLKKVGEWRSHHLLLPIGRH